MTTQRVAVDVDAIAARFPSHGAVDERTEPLRPGKTLLELVPHRRPLLLRGLAADWQATQKWTWDDLAAKGAGVSVSVTRSIIEQYQTVREDRDLGEYIRSLVADDGTITGGYDQTYVSYSWLLKQVPELRADIPLERLFGRRSFKFPATWIGPAGTITGLHTDNIFPNIFAQIRGRKSFVLFPRGTDMYKSDKYEFGCWYSAVDLQKLDFDRFPRLRDATPLVAHLDEGDALFIPPRWWHFVISETPSVSVSTFFGTLRHAAPWALPEWSKNIAHRLGLYARGNCMCHG